MIRCTARRETNNQRRWRSPAVDRTEPLQLPGLGGPRWRQRPRQSAGWRPRPSSRTKNCVGVIHRLARARPFPVPMLAFGIVGGSMTVDWHLADLAVRVTGGLLCITCACLLFTLLKCATEGFGAVRRHGTGNSGAGDVPNEGTTTTEPSGTAHQSHAVRAARDVIARAGDRNNVRPEHVLFYDFVTAAAKAVLGDPALAEKMGKQMKANVWRGSPEVHRRPLAEAA